MTKKGIEIYMDYAAATPVDPRVFKAVQKYFCDDFANPSSVHTLGLIARRAMEDSRKKVATVLACQPSEIVFSSGGTESNNMAIFGVAKSMREKYKYKGGHIVTSSIEHHAILSPICVLESEGFEVTILPVDKDGVVNPQDVKKALRPDTILVSIMYANNEVGTVQPIAEIAKVIRQFRVKKGEGQTLLAHGRGGKFADKFRPSPFPLFHVDACQAPGALSLNVAKLGVDLMTLSGAKMYGPKGVGCLYIKKGVEISTLIYGGGQERGLRSGTENVAGIVGMAEALVISEKMREKECIRLTKLRNYFANAILKVVPNAEINGYLGTQFPSGRLANNLNVYIPDVEGEHLVIELDAIGVSASAGSACHSSDVGQGSHVLMALGHNKKRATGSVRFSLGRSTTKKDIDFVLKFLPEIVKRIRNSSY